MKKDGFRPGSAGKILLATALMALAVHPGAGAQAADWPMYRHDVGRTAATEEQLAPVLHLQWTRDYAELVPAWLGEFPHLRFDANYEPIISKKTLFLSSSDDDSVTALDTNSGGVKWRFYANGPVRLAPAAWQDRLYFGADDGLLYCLDAGTGRLLWKFDTALSARKGFIEGRLTTICPIRGGPIVLDGKVHFTAGIWSFEDSAFFSLDALTGKLVHMQKGTRSQGYPAAIGPWLYLPNGRVGATRVNSATGQRSGGLGGWAGYWDHLVMGRGDWAVRMGNLQKFGSPPNGAVCEAGPGRCVICFYRPVLSQDVIYYSAAKSVVPRIDKPGPEIGDIVAVSLREPALVDAKDKDGKPILDRQQKPLTKIVLTETWRLPKSRIVEKLKALLSPLEKDEMVYINIKAGKRLYGHLGSVLFAVDVEAASRPVQISWMARVEGSPATMVAADEKLFVITLEGRLYCFGAERISRKKYQREERKPAIVKDEWSRRASEILRQTGVSSGYCLVSGLKNGRLVEELFRQSQLQIIAMDKDQELVRSLREKLSYLSPSPIPRPGQQVASDGTALILSRAADIGAERQRIRIIEDEPASFPFPPYMASLIVSERPEALIANPSIAVSLFHSLRPYGGTVCLRLSAPEHGRLASSIGEAGLPRAELKRQGGLSLLSRVGALEGAADWTHEWGDAANTLKSDDHIGASLGMLWTGGQSARREMYFDRHLVPPSPVIVDGRMFLPGPKQLTAVDIYTGRVLWEVQSEVFTAMNRGRGGCHTIGASDGIYVSTRKRIFRFDPRTGRVLAEFGLPADIAKDYTWGRGRIWKDALITSAVIAQHDKKLIALDRRSGKVLWTNEARSSFSFLAIGNDRIFCWDGSKLDLNALKASRRGIPAPKIPGRYLKAFDAHTGRELWRTKTDTVVDWVSYSEPLDVLVVSTRKRIQAFRGSDGIELWHRYAEGIGFWGHPGRVWQKVILWHDWMIDQRGPGFAYDLLTGSQITRPHPVTLEQVPWEFIRVGHHCNHAIASEELLTFRSSNASFVDLKTLGTGTFPGFRTGCTNSLVPADGILNAPMYAHLCVCGYEFYTSLAFANISKVDSWTYRPNKMDYLTRSELGRVQRLGINLNAGGERRAPNGTLWFGLGGPRYGYALPSVPVNWSGTRKFKIPSSRIEAPELNWVFATGVEGLTRLNIPLSADKGVKKENHTVRLFFMEPSDLKPGQRVFSVKLQNQEVLKDFDVVKAAGGARRGIVREFDGIKAGAELAVALNATGASKSVLCGIEVLHEGAGTVAPEVHNSFARARVGGKVKIALPYTDVDGPGPYTFKITRPPSKGILKGKGPAFTYTPGTGVSGEDSFTWTVNDSMKDSSEALVRIRLLAPNRAPKAQDQSVLVTAGRAIDVALHFSDEGASFAEYVFDIVRRPAFGSLELQSSNRYSYRPIADFEGDDSFTWKVNDGHANSSLATVTLHVRPDTKRPAVAWIDSAGPEDRIKVFFTEPVANRDAEDIANYSLDNGAEVLGAKVSGDGKSVTLTTSRLSEGPPYSLAIRNIRDRAPIPNRIWPGARVVFNYEFIGNGLKAEYYEGKDFNGKLIGSRIDPYIQFDWRTRKPFENMEPLAAYSVRWTGRLKADYSEEYMLYFFRGWEHNSNPARIWVDGKLLAKESYGPVLFEAGKTYDLKVELNVVRPEWSQYADNYQLRWSSLSTPKQTIPQMYLGTPRE